jgi:epoxyqueuosine reductase
MLKEVLFRLEESGLKGQIVSADHVPELLEEIEAQHRQKLFDEEYYQELRTYVSFDPPEDMARAESLIVVSIPQPQIRVVFDSDRSPFSLMIPPTYLHGARTNKQVENLLAETLAPQGYHVAPASLPLKLLTVHSGLGAYGKNNVTYVSPQGSFHRLACFYSDVPCPEDSWHDLKVMEACQKCSACLRSCPTGAINSDRFLLRAERCITFHNEHPNDIAFPKWIDPSWHNCLVGCLQCQHVCPQNKDVLQQIEAGPQFTEEETELLLEPVSLEDLPTAAQKKLERFDMVDFLDFLARNLGALIKRQRGI